MVDRNCRTTEFGYDKLYRTTTETWKTGGTTNRTLDYSYDASSRLTDLDDSDTLATDFDFVYDNLSQLQNERQLTGLVGTSVVFDRMKDRPKLSLNAFFFACHTDSLLLGHCLLSNQRTRSGDQRRALIGKFQKVLMEQLG